MIRRNPSVALTRTALGLSIQSDLGAFQLTGADAGVFFEHVAPLLDGTRDREAVLAALPGYSPRSLTVLLDALRSRGLIERVPEAPVARRGQEEFFRAWSRQPEDLSRRLAEARVLVVGRTSWCGPLAGELAAAGVGTVKRAGDESALEGEAWSLLVVAAAPDHEARVERIARFAHDAGVPSLWGHLGGTTAVVGPLVVPGETACRVCATVEGLNPGLVGRGETGGGEARRAAREGLLAHQVAMEALKVISGYAPATLGGRVVVRDLVTMGTVRHTLVRVPWCRVCGEAGGREAGAGLGATP